MTWTSYHRLATIHQYLTRLESLYPHLVETFSIGQSSEGRDILVAKVSKDNGYEKPAIFIEGGEGKARRRKKPTDDFSLVVLVGIHAREWISPATSTFILMSLVEHSDANADLLDRYDFFIMPVMNPDGSVFTLPLPLSLPFQVSQRCTQCLRSQKSARRLSADPVISVLAATSTRTRQTDCGVSLAAGGARCPSTSVRASALISTGTSATTGARPACCR